MSGQIVHRFLSKSKRSAHVAKLIYPSIIEKDAKFTALAELGTRLNLTQRKQIISTLVELLEDKFIELLAEKWSVTGYDGLLVADSESSKTKLIKNAIHLHKYKGTPWAIREVLRTLGFGEVEIDEGLTARDYRSNQRVLKIPKTQHWACYAIKLNNAITNEQAANIRKILINFAPARCVLAVLDYKAVPIRYNNKVRYDGQYNHGSA